MVMLPSRALWLRLLVTALLCVAGLARPVGPQREANGVRIGEPMHVSAPGRAAEVSRLGASGVEDPSTETSGILDDALSSRRVASVPSVSRSTRHADPCSAEHDGARARGPPLA
jgi:hypothetical protein